MNTTPNTDDTVVAQLKREAQQNELPPLPTFHGGGALVDIANRDALHGAMDGRQGKK